MSNHHCSVISIHGHGVLIEGTSGAGKTSLALGLLERAKAQMLDARFVADDQALLDTQSGILLASVPDVIAGKVEIRGYGIAQIEHQPSTQIDVIVRLVPDEEIERMPRSETVLIHGVEIPLLLVPTRHEAQAARIVLTWLNQVIS